MADWGLESEPRCLTNGKGPEIYSKCAIGSVYTEIDRRTKKETLRTVRHKSRFGDSTICIHGYHNGNIDAACRAFSINYAREVFIVPLFLRCHMTIFAV